MLSSPPVVLVERQRKALMRRMETFYGHLTGSKCEAGIFVVSRESVRGCYFVHRLDSCDFYEVNIKAETYR